jgi:competence protein ComEC
MLCGGVATITGLVWLPLGQVLGWIAWLFLTYTIGAVEITASIPYASLSLGYVSPVVVWIYYSWLAWKRGWIRAIWLALIPRWPDGKLHVTFLDVGEGDAIFVQTPKGRKFLIDGGPSPTILASALSRRMPFWDCIDLVILTHADEDHIAGLIPVLERYRVAQVLDSGSYKLTSLKSRRWLELIEEKRVLNQLARAEMQIKTADGVDLSILHPGPELMRYMNAEVNNNSVVTRLVMGQISFLLPGDIEKEAEAILIASEQELTSTVLKAPHHGSNTSSSAAFLRAVDPKLAIISVGADNEFGHPSPKVLERLERVVGEEHVLRTDENGTIEVVTDGERIWIKCGTA